MDIADGELVVFVGPSGCGKSTLLKMISGLLAPSTGQILVEGEQVTKPHGNVGIVFQNALLLRLTLSGLHAKGFEVITHRRVPPNDGGIALGQLLVGNSN